MFHDQRMSVDGRSPEELRAEYDEDLRAAVERVGLSTAVEQTGVPRVRLEELLEGRSPDLTLDQAAAIQALADGTADPETVVEIACEHLLLGMSTGVLDVETVARESDLDLDAKEVQQKIERRAPMTFDEFVHLQHVIAANQR